MPLWVALSITGGIVWLVLLVLVHIASRDVAVSGFPNACIPFVKQLGCSRVAKDNPHR
jgi:hypothetical protein